MAFVGVYRAIYDYQPQSKEELEIKEGDLLFVLETSSEDAWWKCKKKAVSDDDDEPEGLVPNNYVEQARPAHTARALYDYTKQTDEELSFKEDTRLDVYDQSDPDWTLVGHSGEYGFAPTIYIEAVQAGSASAAATAPAPPSMPGRSQAADEPLPGEADYPGPGSASSPQDPGSNPATALAGIIAQRTGGTPAEASPTGPRQLAAPPPFQSRQYTPEGSEVEEPPPPRPQRPQSQARMPPPIDTSRHLAPRSPEPPRSAKSPSGQRIPSQPTYNPEEPQKSPGGYRLYNIHEMISHMGKNKKLPTTLGIDLQKATISISPEKSRDGPSYEWTADKLTHYSIEGKHVFVDLVRPSKNVDFHAGAKDTAQEIVAQLGELAGWSRGEGLREVMAASAGTGAAGNKIGRMLYEFMAQGEDEVTVAAEDEVIVLDDTKSDEWWMVRRMKNGKEGVVPSSYVEITGTVPRVPDSGLEQARNTVEQNRLEEERLTKEAAKRDRKRDTVGPDVSLPERHSSLAGDSGRDKRSGKDASKSKPNQARVRTWTDRSGTFKVDAEFIGLREGKIHLHKTNGVKIAVPVTKMAVEDLEYVERATGTSLDEDKPLSDIKRRSTLKKREDGANGSRAGASVEPKAEYDWFDFFLGCGCNPQICERYANNFSKDQMGPETLPDVNEQLLRTLGVKEGDILRVMKTLNEKFGRTKSGQEGEKGDAGSSGLFSGPGGALRNNTRKGRPAPAVQTNDVVSEDAFKPKSPSPGPKEAPAESKATPLTNAPARNAQGGFDDDAWDVKPARTQTPETAKPAAPVEPHKPRVNEDIASLSLSSLPLQPTKAPSPQPAPAQTAPEISQPAAPQAPQQPQGANQEIFNKIAALAPARQRPQPPPQQPTGGAFGMPPPPRASSAPGFPPQQTGFGAPPLQPQLTGYNPQQQYQGQMQPQQTGYPPPMPQNFQQQSFPNQANGFMPQQTGLQPMQQNYPALQPQPTGMAFQPQSQFGQQAQTHHYGQPNFQQQMQNGTTTGSPFADPPRGPYQPQQTGMQTGMQPNQFSQQTPSFLQQTGVNGFGSQQQQQQQQPQMPPQQTGGVFGPSQPIAPLQPQKTGPAPNIRFGVTGGQNKLQPQPTGRADLSRATPQNPFGF